jgi:two-component sensor histidine kinase
MLMAVKRDAARRQWVAGGLSLALWTFLALFEAAYSAVRDSYRGLPVDWAQSILLHLALWYGWGLLSLPALAYTRRFPLAPGTWWYRLPMGLAAAIALALVKLALDYPVIEAFYCPAPGLMSFLDYYRAGFATQFHRYVLIAGGILGVAYAWTHSREQHRRELRAWQLEARLAQAQLDVLRMQLHPHFLFNTLQAIAALIRRDADAAERALARLGDLLRHLLDTSSERQVALGQELRFLRAYLDIEQLRFGPRLTARLDVDPGLHAALVPPLILQPLVENAVRHGIARCDGPGRVEVRARRDGDVLRLEVWDNGPGLADAPANGARKSIGLANTRARLAHLFGARQRLEVRSETEGVLAAVELPWCEGLEDFRPPVAPAADPDARLAAEW